MFVAFSTQMYSKQSGVSATISRYVPFCRLAAPRVARGRQTGAPTSVLHNNTLSSNLPTHIIYCFTPPFNRFKVLWYLVG